MAKTGKWIECSKKAPCQVCGRTDWCGRSIDPDTGKAYHRCMSSGADSPPGMRLVKDHPDGGRTYTDGSPDVAGRIGPGGSSGPAGGDASVSREMLERLASDYVQNIDAARAIVVAQNLGVPVASLAAVRMGWNPTRKALTFPEQAGGGGVVGIPHRYGTPEAVGAEGEEKRSPKGHHRGLAIPIDLRSTTGIVLVVEGPTDVAAAHALGIPAVGRPSNTGGVTDLAIALADREVIVLGEFDPKPSGDWPGRDGARAVALGLANRWGKPVRWSMPPDRAKDLRRWVQATLPGISDDGRFTAPPEAVESARNRLMLTVREMAKEVSPETGDADDTRPVIANATVEVDSDGKTKFLYVPLPAIVSTIARHTDGWPRRVSGVPFAVAGGPTDEDEVFLPDEGMIRMLDDTDHLFAWIHEWGAPFWTNKVCHDKATNHLRTAVSKAELSAQLAVRANPNYISVETLPHHPSVDGAFYLPTRLPESDGSALAEFAARLNARSEIDRSLLVAALLTPGWGGPTGKRPIFLITSERGVGVGKTTTARMISSVWGRDIALRPDDEWQKIQTAIVSPAAVGRRIVLLDDARGSLKIPALESALTADEFQGHRLYVGHYTVPNRKTIFITSGDPSLGHDLADRAVPIYIGANQHASDHDEWWSDFIANRRAALIADIMALLAGPAKCEIDPDLQTRWRIWQLAILSRFENGNELAEAIAANQQDLDSERESAEEVAMAISVMAAKQGIDAGSMRFTISVNDLHAEMIRMDISKPKSSTRGFSGWLNRLRKNFSCLGPLEPYGSRRLGRRWMWNPPGSSGRTAHLQFADSTGVAILSFDRGDDRDEGRDRPRVDDDLPI